jgi:hypothetical protein
MNFEFLLKYHLYELDMNLWHDSCEKIKLKEKFYDVKRFKSRKGLSIFKGIEYFLNLRYISFKGYEYNIDSLVDNVKNYKDLE